MNTNNTGTNPASDSAGLDQSKNESEIAQVALSLIKNRVGVREVELSDLSVHPQTAIYDPRSDEQEEAIASSIGLNGFYQRILVTTAFLILVGVRRFNAAKKAGLKKVEVEIIDVAEEDIPMFIVDSNSYRIKSHVELYRELKIRKAHYVKKQGTRTDLQTDLTETEKMHTDDRLANEMNISASKVARLEKVGDTDLDLLRMIDNNDDVYLTETAKACSPEKPKHEKIAEECPISDIKLCPVCGNMPKRIDIDAERKLIYKSDGHE